MVVTIREQDGVAVVTIDNPPVNATSQTMRQSLMEAVTQTEADPAIIAVVLACAGKTFVAGADVAEFGKPPMAPHLPDVIDAIEGATKPWVAALHGTVLGGGLELAMGCHARVAATGTRLCLDEVTLGLIPGAGGTVRLPRLVPATKALEMIAGGKPIDAKEAHAAGLVDDLVTGDLTEAAVSLASNTSPTPTLRRTLKPFDQSAYDTTRSKFLAKASQQIAPQMAVAAVDRALAAPVAAARQAERDAFLTLKDSGQSAALRHIFFAERKTLSDPRTKGTPRRLSHIGVIGGGTMGAGIAAACLMRGLAVTLVEQSEDRANAARATIAKTLEGSAKRGVIADANATLDQLATTTTYDALQDADLVIEAVFEDIDVKKQVFRQIEAVTRPAAIIATNTSYLNVNAIAAVLRDPSRAIGLHFFSPAHVMKLLEIVLPDAVADDVVATAAALSKRLGKIGVLAGVCDGFIGNRIMSSYRHEADVLLTEGALPDQIDVAMRGFGFAIGIYQMQDLAGLDIAWAMRKRRLADHGRPDDYIPIADRLCEAGRFGRKTKAGWYDYSETGQVPSDFVADVIATERDSHGGPIRTFSTDDIITRLLGRMRAEAQAVLAEGIAKRAEDIDVVMVNGYGFPRWRGGPSRM